MVISGTKRKQEASQKAKMLFFLQMYMPSLKTKEPKIRTLSHTTTSQQETGIHISSAPT